MKGTNASQGSRRDARNPAEVRWPRVGAKLENGRIVVRLLDDGERPDAPAAVRTAEPCAHNPEDTILAAAQRAAASLVDSLRRAGATLPVEVATGLAR